MFGRDLVSPIQISREPLIEDFIDQRAFSGTGDTGDTCEHTQRNVHIQAFQIVHIRAAHFKPCLRLSPLSRDRNETLAFQISACDGFRARDNVIHRTDRDKLSAVLSGSRAYINDTVSRAHCILVMLDDDQGVSEISQIFQRVQKLVIITLMETDTGFVQNVGNSHQAGSDLGRESDSLGFAAGQSPRRTGQGQIIESDVSEERHTGNDLLQYLSADRLLCLVELQFFKEVQQFGDRIVRHLGNILISDRDSQGRRFQPLTAAGVAWGNLHEFLIFPLGPIGPCLPVSPVQVLDEAFKCYIVHTCASLTGVMHFDLVSFCSVDQNFPDGGRILVPRCVEIESVLLAQRFEGCIGEGAALICTLPAHGCDRAVVN